MDSSRSAVATPWRQPRFGFVAFVSLSLIAGWTLLRVVLFVKFGANDVSFAGLVKLFGIGLQRDQPFSATVLPVSNHKPHTYPEGRIPAFR